MSKYLLGKYLLLVATAWMMAAVHTAQCYTALVLLSTKSEDFFLHVKSNILPCQLTKFSIFAQSCFAVQVSLLLPAVNDTIIGSYI